MSFQRNTCRDGPGSDIPCLKSAHRFASMLHRLRGGINRRRAPIRSAKKRRTLVIKIGQSSLPAVFAMCGLLGWGIIVFYGMAKPVRAPQIGPAQQP
jgi:hypothetical protein